MRGAIATGLWVVSAAATAATWAPGTRVEASPTQMDQFWEVCTIESGPNQWDQYRAECNGYVLPVPAKWIRPLSAASQQTAAAPAAPVQAPPPASVEPAATPPPVAAAPVRRPDGAATQVAIGSYECWAFNSARMDLNFEVTAPGRYTAAADGSEGSFSFDAASGQIRFTGYLGEAMPDGFTSIYYEPHGRPTVSFRGRSGSEASFCEKP